MIKKIVKVVGLLFAAVGLFFILQSCWSFISQIGQLRWEETTATIIQTRERRTSTGAGKHSHSRIVFDTDYEYVVNGIHYEETYEGMVYYKAVGETIPIKYNPDDPSECTTILGPSIATLVVNILAAVLYGFLGLAISGVWADIRARRKKKRKWMPG